MKILIARLADVVEQVMQRPELGMLFIGVVVAVSLLVHRRKVD